MPSFVPSDQQQKFLETADWALNGIFNRGSGKSTVMAYVAVQMAIRGMKVHLFDPSLIFTHGTHHTVHRYFADLVCRIAERHFPEFEFKFSALENSFKCLGTRVPSVPIPTPIPVPAEGFDDDGSDENT